MKFIQKLDLAMEKNSSLLCVGLDPDISKMPDLFQKDPFPLYSFNKAIIDATYPYICAYKPNSAFYEAYGEKGISQLKKTCAYIQKNHSGIPIILDAKRGDIGSTNQGYVSYAFGYLQVDAITVQPYLGQEAMQPFLDEKEKGIIVLCKTSNQGAGELQDMKVEKKPLYLHIAEHVSRSWNENKNCLLVVGATYPGELEHVRKTVGGMTILVPGIGTQGGDLEKTLHVGLNPDKKGLIINMSRSIIHASKAKDFAAKAGSEAAKMQVCINNLRNNL